MQAAHLNVPFVFFSWENLDRPYKPPLKWFRRRVLGLSSAGIAGNSEGVALLRGLGYRKPLALIPQYGVDGRLFKPAKAPKRPFCAGFVGRLAPEKGADLFIRACAKASVPALIYGRGPEEGALRRLAGELRAKVEFKGFAPFEARHKMYRDFDALVLPSLSTRKWKEQFGRVIIEAGACGVPTLGSDSGAIPEVVGKGGIIVPEGDADALAAGLRKLAKGAKRLGAPARKNALERYSEAGLAAQLGDFLESL
jgi:glycosyltransferase involved in cell wall biosynthesis